jgi:hypothetical protein
MRWSRVEMLGRAPCAGVRAFGQLRESSQAAVRGGESAVAVATCPGERSRSVEDPETRRRILVTEEAAVTQ